jgi:hypothetical protein
MTFSSRPLGLVGGLCAALAGGLCVARQGLATLLCNRQVATCGGNGRVIACFRAVLDGIATIIRIDRDDLLGGV